MSSIKSTNEPDAQAESKQYLALLEKRLLLLEALSSKLTAARADFIALDLDSIHTGLREQERICVQIRVLDSDISRTQLRYSKLVGLPARQNEISWPADTADSENAVANKIHGTMLRLAAAQAQLKRVNDTHQCLLRRSRRSVQALLNLFQSYAPEYSVRAAPGTGTLCEERV
jgi:hypothetical protein